MPTSMRMMRSQRRRPLGGANRRPPAGLSSEVMRDHYNTGAIITPAMPSNLLCDPRGRDLIADVPPPDELDAHLLPGRRPAYVGFDPTADVRRAAPREEVRVELVGRGD